MYSWARWIGLRVWKPTTVRQPRSANSARVCAGVRRYANEVVVDGERERAHRSRQAEVARFLERSHARVLEVLGPEHRERLFLTIALEDLGQVDDRERRRALGRKERHRGPRADALHVFVGERQRHRDRPGEPVREMHRVQDGQVVGLAHEPRERRQGADGQHLEVGELALTHDELGQVVRLGSGSVALLPRNEQIHEGPPVGSDRLVVGHGSSAFRLGERSLRIAAGRVSSDRDLYSSHPDPRPRCPTPSFPTMISER